MGPNPEWHEDGPEPDTAECDSNRTRLNRRSLLAGAGAAFATAVPGSALADVQDGTGEPVELALGEVVEGENLHIVVEGTARDLDSSQKESIGFTLGSYFVRLEVKNVSDDFHYLGIWFDSEIIDGENYTYDWNAGSTSPFVGGGIIAPGEVRRGYISYDVPDDATDLTVRFDFSNSEPIPTLSDVRWDLEDETADPDILEQTYNPDVHELSEQAQIDGWDVTLKSAESTTELDEFTQSTRGYEYIVVDVRLVNNTDIDETLTSRQHLLLKSDDHMEYPLNWSPSNALDRKIDDFLDIPAGEERQGKAAYIVDKELEPLYWVFDAGGFDMNARPYWQVR